MDYGLQTFGRETDFEKYQYISSINILDYKKSLFDLKKGLT